MADQAHAVSDADLDATRRLLAATPGLAGEPSDAERSRTLVAMATHATLATVATDRVEGYPFGSLVACAADDAGRVVLCLSDLAVHAVNLAADPRASGLVAARATGDPLAAARVTLVGDLREVPSAENAAARDEYRRVHVDAFYAGFADFRVYRLEPTAVRYVGGFGRMSWVSVADYRGAAPDPLRSQADGILEHMNDDHAEALLASAGCSADGRRSRRPAWSASTATASTCSPRLRGRHPARCGSASTRPSTPRTPCAWR